MRNQRYPLYEHSDIASIADLLEQEAAKWPDRTAFRFRVKKGQTESRSRQEILQDTLRAACRISGILGQGKHVAIIGENTYAWLIAFFAVLSSGNVAVPVDKDRAIAAEIYPAEEFMGNEAYFRELKQKINEGRPAYKQISRISLRDQDFIRNTSKKIVRSKNIPGKEGSL